MKHTPGPWRVCNDGDCKCKQVWCDDHPIADVISGVWGDSYPTIKLEDRKGFIGEQAIAYIEQIVYGKVFEETAKANALLIAAAPELLEALQVSKLMLDGECQHGYDTSRSSRGCDECAEQIEQALAECAVCREALDAA